MYWAVFHAYPTVDTSIGIDLPSLCFFIHSNALGRTFLLAHAAKDTLFDSIEEVTPHIGKWLPSLERIKPGMRLGEEVLNDGSCHVEHNILL